MWNWSEVVEAVVQVADMQQQSVEEGVAAALQVFGCGNILLLMIYLDLYQSQWALEVLELLLKPLIRYQEVLGRLAVKVLLEVI
jgi:hypothetical protein